MKLMIPVEKMVERFLRYVAINTQSSGESESYPSTARQLDLCRLLVEELRNMGLADAGLSEHGYVFAGLPATTTKKVPVIGLIAHVDTSPEVTGANVKPIVHCDYRGGELVLPGAPSLVIRPEDNPALARCIGHDLITTDGTTLLGADDKAGVAEIMTAIDYLVHHPEIAHGPIRVAFTVDEEVGNGTEYFDIEEFGAQYAYTIDGGTAGHLEDETFCADTATVTFGGINLHPGFARGKMLNSQRLAAEFIDFLPKDSMTPETTDGREGYIHLHSMTGSVEKTVLRYLVRDFTTEGLQEKEMLMKTVLETLKKKYPRLVAELSLEEGYRNMKYVLDAHPRVAGHAIEAISRAGLEPQRNAVRGGTDGARLTAMGVPTPNIFTGGHNFHSRLEWISIQDMEKAVETIVHLAAVWEERS
jgi:tripeptide aminopeptidase